VFFREFKAFLLKQNMVALATAVVLGNATNNVVKAIVDDFIMPIVTVAEPSGRWRELALEVGPVRFLVGDFLSALLNFVVIGFVVWQITRAFVKPDAKAATRPCPYCKQNIDATATRCAFCTSELQAA
jgi:large conductance mechanosensitive channel